MIFIDENKLSKTDLTLETEKTKNCCVKRGSGTVWHLSVPEANLLELLKSSWFLLTWRLQFPKHQGPISQSRWSESPA